MAAVAPKLTAVAPVKLVPVMVTVVPPVVVPLVGVKLVMVGRRHEGEVSGGGDRAAGVVTVMVTVPAAWALVTALMVRGVVTV